MLKLLRFFNFRLLEKVSHRLITAFVSQSSNSVARRIYLPVFLENDHSDSFDVFFEHFFNTIDEF